MATNLSKVLKHIHHLLAPPGGDQTDGELLARFVATRDEASFAALVRRHGPMVLSVCRRMLRHDQDAEDCFQATFLVLARKAARVKRESVGSWLYAVAYRTSLEARAVNARRRTREKQMHDMPHPEVMPPEVQDWRPWLDQELNRLPEKFRAVIVACDLEGRSRKEAARHLGIAEGTLSSRLARGRRLLAQRLAPYGLSLTGAALGAALCESIASAQVPAALVLSTTKTALLVAAGELAAVSASSAILMKGVLKSMFLTKLKMMVGTVMVVTALGACGLVYRASGQSASPAEKRSDGKPKSELERLRHENELLKLNLEVVLEKVRAQEAELRALKAQPAHAAITAHAAISPDGQKLAISSRGVVDLNALPEGTPLRIVIDQIQKPRNKEELQRAIDEMEKALKGLREQLKNDAVPKKGKAKEESQREQSQLEIDAKELESLRKMEDLKKSQSDSLMWQERAAWSERMSRPGRQYVTVSQAEADQARHRSALFDEAKVALEVLREARDAETQRKAADALDKALKQLRQQGGQKEKPDSGKR
jgi:RNA polymerase sigma factor (sigma-70 family)